MSDASWSMKRKGGYRLFARSNAASNKHRAGCDSIRSQLALSGFTPSRRPRRSPSTRAGPDHPRRHRLRLAVPRSGAQGVDLGRRRAGREPAIARRGDAQPALARLRARGRCDLVSPCVDSGGPIRHLGRVLRGASGQVAEWLKAADCKSARVSRTLVRIQPCPPSAKRLISLS